MAKKAKKRAGSTPRKTKRARKQNPQSAQLRETVVRLTAEVGSLKAKMRRSAPKKRKANPGRGRERWYERVIHRPSLQRWRAYPPASVSAAWWHYPEVSRIRTVEKMAKGTPRQRRGAMQLAKAEEKHARGRSKKKTPKRRR